MFHNFTWVCKILTLFIKRYVKLFTRHTCISSETFKSKILRYIFIFLHPHELVLDYDISCCYLE